MYRHERRTLYSLGGVRIVGTGGLELLESADTIVIAGWPDVTERPPRTLVRAACSTPQIVPSATQKVRLQQALSQFQRTKRRQADQIVALSELARCQLQTGEIDRAIRLASEATALARKFALPDQPSYRLGLALLAQVDVEQALGQAEKALLTHVRTTQFAS